MPLSLAIIIRVPNIGVYLYYLIDYFIDRLLGQQGKHLKGLKPGETAEEGFKRLERENDELREANHILKKAMGFLAGR